MTRLTDAYFDQVARRHTVIMASVVDKRFLRDGTTHETLRMTAYEFLLERIQHYMRQYHPKRRALIVMDDTGWQLSRAVAMKHASFQRAGNRNMTLPAIVEYPLFTRSELSNGVQLADLLAYSVYRAFKGEDLGYPYFERLLGNFYRRLQGTALDGLEGLAGPLAAVRVGKQGVGLIPTRNPPNGGSVMSGWANHIEPIKSTRRRICRMKMRQCQSRGLWNVGILQRSLHEAWRQGARPSTGRALLARRSEGAGYKISVAMLTAMRSADSLTESRARCV